MDSINKDLLDRMVAVISRLNRGLEKIPQLEAEYRQAVYHRLPQRAQQAAEAKVKDANALWRSLLTEYEMVYVKLADAGLEAEAIAASRG